MEFWQALGIIAGAVLAVFGVIAVLVKILYAAWTIRDRQDDLAAMVNDLRAKFDAHLVWHGPTRELPAVDRRRQGRR